MSDDINKKLEFTISLLEMIKKAQELGIDFEKNVDEREEEEEEEIPEALEFEDMKIYMQFGASYEEFIKFGHAGIIDHINSNLPNKYNLPKDFLVEMFKDDSVSPEYKLICFWYYITKKYFQMHPEKLKEGF